MKKLTKKIFLVVLLASLVSVSGLLLLAKSIERTTSKYQSLVDEQMLTHQMMTEISNQMFQMQTAASEMVVQADAANYDEYDKMISNSQEKIDQLMATLSKRIEDSEKQDLLHKVNQDYKKYISEINTAEELCKQNMQDSAVYYVCTIMESYLNSATSNISVANEKLALEVQLANKQLKSDTSMMYILRNVLIIVDVVVISLCILFTYRNGHKIVSTQLQTHKEHINRLIDIQNKTIIGMANLIESRDGETGEHVKRTSTYVKMICDELIKERKYSDILTERYVENLCKSAPLHDVGKIKVPDSILQKPGKLSRDEFDTMKLHTVYGGEVIPYIISDIHEEGYLEMATDVAMYHHEKWNGQGYPKGLSGDKIPLSARIMAVADVFDALVSKRCYKKAFDFETAYGIIEESSGSHFDPVVAQAFLNMKEDIRAYLADNIIK